MADSFLPDNYEPPQSGGNYMRFEIGENKFRVLSSAIVGWEWWTTTAEGKRQPNRVKNRADVPAEYLTDAKHFWAMVVWNYKEKKVQILEVTQKGIMRTIAALANDKEWGTPFNYDISVVREGEGLDTEYQTIPSPPKPLNEEVKDTYDPQSINLAALYKGEDPFAVDFDFDAIDKEISK